MTKYWNQYPVHHNSTSQLKGLWKLGSNSLEEVIYLILWSLNVKFNVCCKHRELQPGEAYMCRHQLAVNRDSWQNTVLYECFIPSSLHSCIMHMAVQARLIQTHTLSSPVSAFCMCTLNHWLIQCYMYNMYKVASDLVLSWKSYFSNHQIHVHTTKCEDLLKQVFDLFLTEPSTLQ